jgi:hypothetical protein
MLLTQQFKTLQGALKRAAFEAAHCDKRYSYRVVRCLNGAPQWPTIPLDPDLMHRGHYTWRIEKTKRGDK